MTTEIFASGRRPRTVLIAGPTASGKSALALDIARLFDGVIINADSMQVYAEMRVLTARPSLEDEAAAPHRLYGHVGAAEPYSVARWLEEVAREIAAAETAGLLPIIVGGTGLYFKALLEGLSPVPPIPDEVRLYWRQLAATTPPPDLHAELVRRDPETAMQLRPTDRQRLVRALEVIDATGRPLAQWQAVRGRAVVRTEEVAKLVVAPPRDDLYARSERRFEQMLEQGALDEAEIMAQMQLSQELPAMRALGLRPLMSLLAHECGREQAIAAAKQETRHYIKRQLTWLRRHMIAWNKVETKEMKRLVDIGFPIIDLGG